MVYKISQIELSNLLAHQLSADASNICCSLYHPIRCLEYIAKVIPLEIIKRWEKRFIGSVGEVGQVRFDLSETDFSFFVHESRSLNNINELSNVPRPIISHHCR